MMNAYRIETTKGSHEGTLEEVWAWQEEHQGSFASLVLPTGERVDVAECTTLTDVRQILREETETVEACLEAEHPG